MTGGLWDSSRLIGRVNCQIAPPDKMAFGAWIRPAYRGRHLVPQAVSYLCDYAFRWRDIKLAWLITRQDNQAARRTAERSGFALWPMPDPFIQASTPLNHVVYVRRA